MGWIEDAHGAVLMVKQARGRKLWTLPGGKIEATEHVEAGLRREIFEETGVRVAALTQIALFDRAQKRNITFLYRVALQSERLVSRVPREISLVEFRPSLPHDCSPSLRHFWNLLRGGV